MKLWLFGLTFLSIVNFIGLYLMIEALKEMIGWMKLINKLILGDKNEVEKNNLSVHRTR